MSTEPAAGPSAPVHPLDLPSDTDLRFYLLVGTVLAASLYLFQMAYLSLPGIEAQIRTSQLQCIGQLWGPPDVAWAYYNSCSAPFAHQQAIWMVAGPVALLLIAWAQYRAYPALIIRRNALRELTDEDFPGVRTAVEGLFEHLGLRRPLPRVYWNPAEPRVMALAFGSGRRRNVLLSKGLLMAYFIKRPVFQAVMLHELAHFKNGDVNKTHLALSIWRTFALAALVPLGLALWQGHWLWTLNVAWRLLLLAGIVVLMRNALLRTRELYADAQAKRWEAPASNVAMAVAAQGGRAPSRWRYLQQVHPTIDERLSALEEPFRIVGLGWWDLLGAGVATSAALPGLRMLISLALQATSLQAFSEIPLAIVAVAPAGMLLALIAWRFGLAPRSVRNRLHDALPLAAGFGIGMVAGRPLAIAVDTLTEPPGTLTVPQSIAAGLAWGLLLLALLWLYAGWLTWLVDAWLPLVSSVSRALVPTTAGLAGLLFAACYSWLDTVSAFQPIATVQDGLVALIAGPFALSNFPPYWLVPLGFCALPLAALAKRSSESSNRPLVSHQRITILRWGLLAMGLSGLTMLVLALDMRLPFALTLAGLDARDTLYTLQSVFAVGVQVWFCVSVARRLERWQAPLGLLAGMLVGAVATIAALVFNDAQLGDAFRWAVWARIIAIDVSIGFWLSFAAVLLVMNPEKERVDA